MSNVETIRKAAKMIEDGRCEYSCYAIVLVEHGYKSMVQFENRNYKITAEGRRVVNFDADNIDLLLRGSKLAEDYALTFAANRYQLQDLFETEEDNKRTIWRTDEGQRDLRVLALCFYAAMIESE